MNRGTTTPLLAAGHRLLDGITSQDFASLGAAMAHDARLRALLPGGLREWTGSADIADRFARWFGDAEELELVESAVDEVGGRAHLRWRLRLRSARIGPGWFVVEQVAYADLDEDDQVAQLDLLCTGYRPERSDG
jgi:hypothetical protein